MSKKTLNEGIIERLLTGIFMSVAQKKEQRLLAQLEKDPVMKQMAQQLVDSRDRLEKYLQRRRNDPKWKATEDEFNRLANKE